MFNFGNFERHMMLHARKPDVTFISSPLRNGRARRIENTLSSIGLIAPDTFERSQRNVAGKLPTIDACILSPLRNGRKRLIENTLSSIDLSVPDNFERFQRNVAGKPTTIDLFAHIHCTNKNFCTFLCEFSFLTFIVTFTIFYLIQLTV